MRPMARYWNLIQPYIHDRTSRIVLLSGFFIGSVTLRLIQPIILRMFIDAATSDTAARSLLLYGLTYSAIALLTPQVTTRVRRFVADVRREVTDRLSEYLPDWTDGDMRLVAGCFSSCVAAFGGWPLLVGAVALLVREALILRFDATDLALFLVALLVFRRVLSPRRIASAKPPDALGEAITAIEGISAGRAANAGAGLRALHDSVSVAEVLRSSFGSLTSPVGLLIALGLGACLWRRHAGVGLGSVAMMVLYADIVCRSVVTIEQGHRYLEQATTGIKRIQGMLL